MGFNITIFPAVYMLCPQKHNAYEDSSRVIRRISEVSDDLVGLIHSEGDGNWTIKVLQKHLSDRHFHLLGLYQSGKCVSMASVKTMDGYSRVDDVVTHMNYRGKHFGTRLMEHLVRYHRTISDNYLYLWATNPIAIRMYLGLGFREIHTAVPYWSATVE